MTQDPHAAQPVLHAGAKLGEASGVVILLHGRGASAEDILSLEPEFDRPDLAYFAPQAAGQAWYPYSFLAPIAQNEPWLSSALNKISRIIEGLALPSEKIFLAGFSQGACLATEFVARNPAHYGGLIAFTGGLIGAPGTKFAYPGTLAGMPAFMGSGDPDPHVPWKRVEESAAMLTSMGADLTLERYVGMPHMINQSEIDHARLLLSRAR